MEEERSEYLFKLFLDHGGSKGYLTKEETYGFFLAIHNLIMLRPEKE